jgi:uncharacterized membrane protein YhaH (DUF805 family)
VSAVRWLFSFDGKIGRAIYAASAIPVFLSQHLLVLALLQTGGSRPPIDFWFCVLPVRALTHLDKFPGVSLLYPALAYSLIAGWILAALSFRRARDADVSEIFGAIAIVPLVQTPVLLCLSIFRSNALERAAQSPTTDNARDARAAVQGIIGGTGLTLLAVAVGTLIFGQYGYALFVFTPFLVGATTGYLGNRRADIGTDRTTLLALGAMALGGHALIVTSLEGALCIVAAAPLAAGVVVFGGYFGRATALYSRRSPRQTLSTVAILPVIFAIESLLPATTTFETVETIAVAATPERAWQAVTHMGTISEPPALPFRLGVAYPIDSEIIGDGVGAVRRGTFSTGVATERITEWAPNQKLAFVVVTDVPSMRELGPYEHVHAPHVVGYFRTTLTSFELVPRSDGGTDIVEHTAHELALEPVLYWLPLARWIVHENNMRVLAHIRDQAELGSRETAAR